jgi:hypothetical protein
VIDPASLEGRWVHSHEEDTDDELVYRSASSGYDFPRSRGREALELHPDGSYGGTAPGPTDKPEASGSGNWALEDGNKLVLPDRVLEITAAEGDVLRVKKRSG